MNLAVRFNIAMQDDKLLAYLWLFLGVLMFCTGR